MSSRTEEFAFALPTKEEWQAFAQCLEEENAELRRDAERYRWLRCLATDAGQLNAVIDQAMKEEK